jgi:hypothetical protein
MRALSQSSGNLVIWPFRAISFSNLLFVSTLATSPQLPRTWARLQAILLSRGCLPVRLWIPNGQGWWEPISGSRTLAKQYSRLIEWWRYTSIYEIIVCISKCRRTVHTRKSRHGFSNALPVGRSLLLTNRRKASSGAYCNRRILSSAARIM